MDLGTLAPVAGGLLAGWLGKKAGKSKQVGGDLDFQKLLAPLLAVGGATATANVVSPELPLEALLANGGQAAVWAIFAHTILKNITELLRQIVAMRKEA